MNLITKNFNSFRVRILLIDGKEWFIAKDIAELLEYKKSANAIKTHCKKPTEWQEFNKVTESMTFRLHPQTKLILESDVWRLIIKSEMPEAEKIEEWIMEEVLPSIRKTGSYFIDSKPALEKPKEINLKKLLSNIQIIRSTLELKPFEMLMMDRFDPENSPIDKMGIDLSGVLLLPTELGKLIGKSAIEVNILLSQKGYQVKVNGIWQLTEKGRKFGVEINGKFQQIKWRVEAL